MQGHICVQRKPLKTETTLKRFLPISRHCSLPRSSVGLTLGSAQKYCRFSTTMLHKNKRVVASAILAMAISTDAAFSNVKITQFQQSGLDLSFLVSWTTAESRASDSHSEVDIWLQTRGPDPSSFMETVLQQVLSFMPRSFFGQ